MSVRDDRGSSPRAGASAAQLTLGAVYFLHCNTTGGLTTRRVTEEQEGSLGRRQAQAGTIGASHLDVLGGPALRPGG